jgi:hypothetical protein
VQEVRDSFKAGTWYPINRTERQLANVLKLSFDDLPHEGKNMFLDCVSVMYGQDSSKALAVWAAWWRRGQISTMLDEQQRRSLVQVDSKGRLGAHDVIRTLGQAMLQRDHAHDYERSEFYCSRVWVGPDGCLIQLAEVSTWQQVQVLHPQTAASVAHAKWQTSGWACVNCNVLQISAVTHLINLFHKCSRDHGRFACCSLASWLLALKGMKKGAAFFERARQKWHDSGGVTPQAVV